MNEDHERFISNEDEELKRIREKKLKELVRLEEKTQKMNVKPVQLTDSNFTEITNKNHLALIDCWASWCAPCMVIAPIIEELAKDYAGKVTVGKLNVDENRTTAARFQIFSIPTLLIMKNGKEVDRIIGLVPKNQIQMVLEKHLR